MKLTLKRALTEEEEVIIKYHKINETIKSVVAIIQGSQEKIKVETEEGTQYIPIEKILYFENVDGLVYAYTKNQVLKIDGTLKKITETYVHNGLFRCSKTMIVNIYRIRYLNSETYSRICATMDNGEKVIISRKYASQLRQVLKEGCQNEE